MISLGFAFAATFASVFGSVPIRVKDIAAIDVPSFDFTCSADCWLAKDIEDARRLPLARRLAVINSAVNRQLRYASDTELYGQLDYWAAPQETALRREGDCEDFAVLKMAALLNSGVAREDMAIVVVKDIKRDVLHAVVSVATDQGNLILDSLSRSIRADGDIGHYTPLFSLNGKMSWIHGQRLQSR